MPNHWGRSISSLLQDHILVTVSDLCKLYAIERPTSLEKKREYNVETYMLIISIVHRFGKGDSSQNWPQKLGICPSQRLCPRPNSITMLAFGSVLPAKSERMAVSHDKLPLKAVMSPGS